MKYDGIIIGGGPAGMFAAITAAQLGQKVLLLERGNRLGKKLLITGKGRCNVTNDCDVREVLKNIPRNSRFLYSALSACPPEGVKSFFEENGCPLKTERGNRVFPISDRSASVLETLRQAMIQAGVTVAYEKRVSDILVQDNHVCGVMIGCEKIKSGWVLLATGGKSYPTTGSTGDGYELAERLGHRIIPPVGSLVPLEADEDCALMQGLSLRNVGVKLVDENGKPHFTDFGELLFTHFGVTGPTVLSASAHLPDGRCRLLLDLKPGLDEPKLNDRILRDLQLYRNRSMENALTDLLPRSMIPVVLKKLEIDPLMQANALNKQNRRALVELLKNFPMEIYGKRPVEEAIITSGGIDVTQISPKTMESKLVEGLFFAGEVIDCDAYTGGFNLQIAWSTSYAAAVAASNR
jgi:predicted Rossmann fold flavoprotein